MPEQISKAELTSALNAQTDTISRVIGGATGPINARLDGLTDHVERLAEQVKETNGRVLKGELEGREQGVQIRHLERAVFDRRKTDPKSPAEPSGEQQHITQRDVRIFVAGALGMAAVFTFLWRLWPLLAKLGQP